MEVIDNRQDRPLNAFVNEVQKTTGGPTKIEKIWANEPCGYIRFPGGIILTSSKPYVLGPREVLEINVPFRIGDGRDAKDALAYKNKNAMAQYVVTPTRYIKVMVHNFSDVALDIPSKANIVTLWAPEIHVRPLGRKWPEAKIISAIEKTEKRRDEKKSLEDMGIVFKEFFQSKYPFVGNLSKHVITEDIVEGKGFAFCGGVFRLSRLASCPR